MEKEEFRRLGYGMVDWVADYLEEVREYPVRARVEPGDISGRLPAEAPLEGQPMDSIMEDFERLILPGMTHWQHPGWFAYFPANNSPPSILAEILTAGMGAQCMLWQTSPAATELEEVVMEWLRGMLGLPEDMRGVIQDTASTATLCALITAREKATEFRSNEEGLRDDLTIYASEETHSSIEKAAKIAGYGRQNVRFIPTDDNYALVPALLEKAISQDIDRGLTPACVVATLGTTSSTAVDPLPAMARICRRHGIWLHVDAAFAGSAAILPEHRDMMEGMDEVDSFVFNPHKWLMTNFDCSAYFVRDPSLLERTFQIKPEYLKTREPAPVRNLSDWGLQLGRRFRALKLWFVIRYYGVKGLQEILREHIRLARLFQGWIEADPRFRIMAPVNLSLVCFRYDDGSSRSQLDQINRELLERINATGRVFLTHTSLRDKFVLRLAIGQRTTREEHVREAWDLISKEADVI